MHSTDGVVALAVRHNDTLPLAEYNHGYEYTVEGLSHRDLFVNSALIRL